MQFLFGYDLFHNSGLEDIYGLNRDYIDYVGVSR